MAEILGIVSSIIAIVEVSSIVIEYLKDVSGASEDVQVLIDEVKSTTTVLASLKSLLDQPAVQSAWTASAKLLAVPNGPIDQFQRALDLLNRKLKPATGKLRRVADAVVWPFKKKEVSNILKSIQRQKTLFVLAIQNSHM